MAKRRRKNVQVRNTRRDDIERIIDICIRVYQHDEAWERAMLERHLELFPEGQLVAVDPATDQVVGMAASLIVLWDQYMMYQSWMELTADGWFTTHEPSGRTLYGAEIMVDPSCQGMGVGKQIYAARRQMCRDLGLRRIRAGARLRGYGRYADLLTPSEYVVEVVNRRLADPTLTFQLKQGFRVIGVVEHYLEEDPASRGHAAIIEWINHQVATRADFRGRDPRFARRRPPRRPSDQS